MKAHVIHCLKNCRAQPCLSNSVLLLIKTFTIVFFQHMIANFFEKICILTRNNWKIFNCLYIKI
ncbi:hypothetical protein TW86_18165 [Halomonas sp. S2151]|nr:hypothetical protein TW86_18165 [Halomonas sp. S2151]